MCWKHLNDSQPLALKEYRCHLCAMPIAVGDRHMARRGVFEGQAHTQRMHIDCEAVTVKWTDNDWENFEPVEFRRELAEKRASASMSRSSCWETADVVPHPATACPRAGEALKVATNGRDRWSSCAVCEQTWYV